MKVFHIFFLSFVVTACFGFSFDSDGNIEELVGKKSDVQYDEGDQNTDLPYDNEEPRQLELPSERSDLFSALSDRLTTWKEWGKSLLHKKNVAYYSNAFENFMSSLSDKVTTWKEWGKSLLQKNGAYYSDAFKNFVSTISDRVTTWTDWFKSLLENKDDSFKDFLSAIPDKLNKSMQWLKRWFRKQIRNVEYLIDNGEVGVRSSPASNENEQEKKGSIYDGRNRNSYDDIPDYKYSYSYANGPQNVVEKLPYGFVPIFIPFIQGIKSQYNDRSREYKYEQGAMYDGTSLSAILKDKDHPCHYLWDMKDVLYIGSPEYAELRKPGNPCSKYLDDTRDSPKSYDEISDYRYRSYTGPEGWVEALLYTYVPITIPFIQMFKTLFGYKDTPVLRSREYKNKQVDLDLISNGICLYLWAMKDRFKIVSPEYAELRKPGNPCSKYLDGPVDIPNYAYKKSYEDIPDYRHKTGTNGLSFRTWDYTTPDGKKGIIYDGIFLPYALKNKLHPCHYMWNLKDKLEMGSPEYVKLRESDNKCGKYLPDPKKIRMLAYNEIYDDLPGYRYRTDTFQNQITYPLHNSYYDEQQTSLSGLTPYQPDYLRMRPFSQDKLVSKRKYEEFWQDDRIPYQIYGN